MAKKTTKETVKQTKPPKVKSNSKKNNKKASVNTSANITNKIPYLHCYDDGGIIEIESGIYSATYEIIAPAVYNDTYVSTIAYNCMEQLFSTLNRYNYRFTIRNSIMNEDEYLQTIYLSEDKEPEVNAIIKDYNNVLKDNVNIGHNNYKMSLYLTITFPAEVPDDAKNEFDKLDEEITSNLKELYGYIAVRLSLINRLEVLYDIYHPDSDSPKFGSKVDYDGSGFSFDKMKAMKMSTKDVITPKFYEAKERSYMKIGDKFVRMLFINSIPSRVTDTLLSDLISISSNSILSVTYTPIDAEFGFRTAAKLVKANTQVKTIAIRDTIEDRKNKRVDKQKNMILENEQEYFHNSTLKLLTESTAKEQPIILTTFIVGLFSDTLEELDRDTDLLKMSASKYAVQIKPCDFQQHEAFITALPLGSTKVDIARTFTVNRLSKLLPMNIQSLFEKKVILHGLNEINDNFVLIDRTNYPLGLIAGMKTSGKTFAMKREIVNTLMSTDDIVVVIAPTPKDNEKDDYAKLINRVNGTTYKPIFTDLFTIDDSYGLTTDNKVFKKMFLESFITLRIGFHKKKYTQEELEEVYNEVSSEAEGLSEFTDYSEAVTYARENAQHYKLFLKSIEGYMPTDEYPDFTQAGRLNLIHFNTNTELLLQIDYLWNFAVAVKKANKNIWIYVDGIDEFIYTPVASDYLISLLDKCNKIKIPFTMVVQNSAKICANDVASIEFDYLLEKINYFKFLSLGVIERKKVVDKLNIPQPLVTYVTDREPSEGLIITPTANVSFNDRFEVKGSPFYDHF